MNIYYYRRLKNVNRLGNEPISRSYNLLEHSYMVTMLFAHFAKLEKIPYTADVLEIIMHHDIMETITGDLPWNVKNYNIYTRDAWDQIEQAMTVMVPQLEPYTDTHIKEQLTPEQHRLFKVCDMLDLWIFLQEERRLGNTALPIYEILQRAKENIECKYKSVDDFIIHGYTF